MLQFIYWNVNPEIFSLSLNLGSWGGFNFALRYYSMAFVLSFLCGYLIISYFFKKENVPHQLLDELTTYVFIATIIGARLGHVLFYEPAYYLSHPIEILKVWEGGLASHGAAITILIALWLFVRKNNKSFLWLCDLVVIVVALSGMFIRLGNLMNSEVYGRPTTVPWAFQFPLSDPACLPRHPTQIYEALGYLMIFIILLFSYLRNREKLRPGIIFSYFLILLFAFRFFIEFFKENQVGFEDNITFNMGQYLSIPFVIIGIVLIYMIKRDKVPTWLK